MPRLVAPEKSKRGCSLLYCLSGNPRRRSFIGKDAELTFCCPHFAGLQTFFGRAAALLGQADQVANIQKVMTKIGAVCLITIGIWAVIELGVQFGHYNHACKGGVGKS